MPIDQLYQVRRHVTLVHSADRLYLTNHHHVNNCHLGPGNVAAFGHVLINLSQYHVEKLIQVLLDPLFIRPFLLAEDFRIGHGLYQFAGNSAYRTHEISHHLGNLSRLCLVEEMV